MTKRMFTLAMGGLLVLSGVLVGIAGGLLFAPQPGERTRRQLRNLADDLSEHASAMAVDAKRMVADTIGSGSGKRVVGL